jgi:hypothetical protein
MCEGLGWEKSAAIISISIWALSLAIVAHFMVWAYLQTLFMVLLLRLRFKLQLYLMRFEFWLLRCRAHLIHQWWLFTHNWWLWRNNLHILLLHLYLDAIIWWRTREMAYLWWLLKFARIWS